MKDEELVVDSFAGGGGASLGVAWATGRGPDVAINHEPKAIAMHAANHPGTRHLTEDVFKANPRAVTGGRPVGLLWASPDCRHHSRAKGGKPVQKDIRGLAWAVVRWAVEAPPRVIVLENVREFQEWGPVVPRWVCRACEWAGTEGQTVLARTRRRCPRCDSLRLSPTEDMIPDPARKGLTFKKFVGRLRGLSYHVEWRVLNAADYGAPTHRRRLFLVARNDGLPVVWPDPSHGDPKKIGHDLFSGDLRPWRTAAECIDWSLPCPSIFLTKEEGKKLGVRRPLADKTLRRIALGIKRYVLDNPRPFVVANTSGNPPTPADMHKSNAGCAFDPQAPLNTVTTGGGFGVVAPVVVPLTHAGERRSYQPTEPLPTITGANRGELAVVAPTLMPHYGGSVASSVEAPLPTVTAGGMGKQVLIAPALVQTGYGERAGQEPRALDLGAPLGTVVAGGSKHALVSAFLAKHYGGVVGHAPDRPIGTVTAVDHHSVVAANLVHLNHGDKTCSGADEPARAVTAQGNHAALVYSFLTKYYKTAVGQAPAEPLHTVTTDDRFGVVTVTLDGQQYAIVDIGMRMLRPRELARAQGFPDDYLLTGTASDQVERIGNSVSPCVARAMVEANYAPCPVGAP